MEFRILGPLEVRRDGRAVALGGGKQRALLAVLLLHANEVVSTGRLIDDLWGETPPGSAGNALQVYVSQLRKTLGPAAITTRAPGYVLTTGPGELDLSRFERLADEGRRALAGGQPAVAAERLREALALWRGPALTDFPYEAFAQPAIARLEELRLAALEERLEADLALGRHAEAVPELEALVAAHPLRERLRGQLMLALYRSGRQAEALDAYQDARRSLVEELGIEPGPALQRLERAILNQDPSLELAGEAAGPTPGSASGRLILVVPRSARSLDPVLALAVPLAAGAGQELVVALPVPPDQGGALGELTAALEEHRARLAASGVPARAAAFTSADRGRDVVRLASRQEVSLLVVAVLAADLDELGRGDLGQILAGAPCDVALLVARDPAPVLDPGLPVLVPFTGAEHDWAALELAAWAAGALGAPLRLAGSAGDPGSGGRDASFLLANASLVLQQLAGVAAEPLLVTPGEQGLLDAAESASLLVAGLPERWRQEGLGPVRAALAARARPATLLVRRGLRPGGLAPRGTLTRYTWSLASAGES